MFQTDPNDPGGRSDLSPTENAGEQPPIIPSQPIAGKRGFKPLILITICAFCAMVLVAAGLIAAALFFRVRNVQARENAERTRVAQVERVERAAAARPASPLPVSTDSSPNRARTEPGISYINDKVSSGPWSVHILKIDRSRKDLMFFSAHARDKVLGVSLIADQARAVPRDLGRAVAGINGDFYVRDNPTYAGDPRGLQIVNGELISAPDTVCVWFDADGNPHLDDVKGDFNVTWPNNNKMPLGLNQQRSSGTAVLYTPTYGPSTRVSGGMELILEKDGDGPWLPLQASQTYRARVREVVTNGNTRLAAGTMVLSIGPRLVANVPELAPGAILQVSTATTPDLKGVKAAIAGGPELIKNGKAFSLRNPPPGTSRNYSEASKYQQHPRSAVGWSPTHIFLVTVDGRQPGLSVGMKLAELAEYMAKLGCTEAMNFDGGKSAQMWMNGRIMNSPAQGEDTVANSLLVVRKPEGQ